MIFMRERSCLELWCIAGKDGNTFNRRFPEFINLDGNEENDDIYDIEVDNLFPI